MSGSITYVTWTYNASSTIAKTADINTNGTGTAYAFACNAATPSYYRAITSFSKNRSTSVFPTYTTSHQYTSEFWDTYTVDCQNITHAHGTTPLSSYVYYNTTTFKNYTSTAGNTYPGPSPSCRIEPDDCKAVQSSYSKESSAFGRFTSSYTPPYYVVNPPAVPSCSTVCTAKPLCMIKGDHVRVIYWPVTTTGANSCRSNGTTVTPTATEIRTIESLGTTFTSPSVYLSFQSLSAYDWGCYKQIGEGISNTIIAMAPESLSSAVGWHLGRSAVSYNLADLNGYVSSAAYFRMQAYDWSGPGTIIYDDLYFPSVWMPDAVLTMRPEWSTCEISQFGVNDPPVALSSVEFLTSEAPTANSKPNSATPVASPSNTDAPKTTATALQDQDTSRGQDSSKESSPATKSVGNQDSSKGSSPATKSVDNQDSSKGNTPVTRPPGNDNSLSATSSANIGGFIASAMGYSRPESQPAYAITITTVKIISIISNGFVDGTKTMSVSALLPGAQIPESSSVKGISIGTEGVVGDGSTVAISSFLASPTAVNYQPHTDNSGSTYVLVGGSSVYAGSGIAIGSHTVSVDGTGIIVDGTRTVSYAVASAIATGPSQASDYQVMATTDSSGQTVVIVGDQTLSISGSAMTIDGHTLSAGSNGVIVDGNGTTIRYATVTGAGSANSTSSSSPSSSTSSISFSTNPASASSAAASSTSSSGTARVHTQLGSSVVSLIFGIGIVYGLR